MQVVDILKTVYRVLKLSWKTILGSILLFSSFQDAFLSRVIALKTCLRQTDIAFV